MAPRTLVFPNATPDKSCKECKKLSGFDSHWKIQWVACPIHCGDCPRTSARDRLARWLGADLILDCDPSELCEAHKEDRFHRITAQEKEREESRARRHMQAQQYAMSNLAERNRQKQLEKFFNKKETEWFGGTARPGKSTSGFPGLDEHLRTQRTTWSPSSNPLPTSTRLSSPAPRTAPTFSQAPDRGTSQYEMLRQQTRLQELEMQKAQAFWNPLEAMSKRDATL